jgi:hypothetical protein
VINAVAQDATGEVARFLATKTTWSGQHFGCDEDVEAMRVAAGEFVAAAAAATTASSGSVGGVRGVRNETRGPIAPAAGSSAAFPSTAKDMPQKLEATLKLIEEAVTRAASFGEGSAG